jgi:hypothetical protein
MNKTTIIENFRDWAADSLPRLNGAAETGRLNRMDVAEALNPWILGASDLLESEAITPDLARQLMLPVTFAVNSIERHCQAAKSAAGVGIGMLPGSEALMLRLSFLSGLPAHGSFYTVWLENRRDPILTFTGDAQEKFFHASVIRTDELNKEACAALRSITTGGVSLESRESVERLNHATQQAQALRRLYASFLVADAQTGYPPITPEFFATRMRTYLVSYPIAGRKVSGGNAGDLPSALALDYMIGTTMERYEGEVMSHRLPNLIPEDRDALRADMTRPSVFDLLSAHLEVPARESIENRGATLALFPEKIRAAAMAFGALVKAHGDASAAHFGLIQNFLVRFERERGQDGNIPTPMDKGTGGIPHGVTEMIMRTRREHPAANWRNV